MKGEPTKGAQLTNEQMLRLNDDDLQRLGERMASRTGVWANEPTHYLAIVLGHLRRTRAERDDARRERGVFFDLWKKAEDEIDEYKALLDALLAALVPAGQPARYVDLPGHVDALRRERDLARLALDAACSILEVHGHGKVAFNLRADGNETLHPLPAPVAGPQELLAPTPEKE